MYLKFVQQTTNRPKTEWTISVDNTDDGLHENNESKAIVKLGYQTFQIGKKIWKLLD